MPAGPRHRDGCSCARQSLETAAAARLVERDCLAVENHIADVEGAHCFDELRYAGRDVVKSAGEYVHVVAGPMQLNPDAVELPFQCHRAALRRLREGSHDIGCRLGEHRQDRSTNLETNGAQGLDTVAQCGCGDRRQRLRAT